jgi:CDP-glucose 4,6-dehydratase
VEAGARVVALIRDQIPGSNFNRLGLAERVDAVSGALEDFECVSRTVAEYEIEACFHLAAQAIVGVANLSPLSTFSTNIQGTWNLLEAARVSRTMTGIVVASSDKAYGRHEVLPYREDAPLIPQYPYDTSKACADLITRCYFSTFHLPVAVTRFANIYGGGDLNFSRIVPDTLRSVLRGNRPIIRSDGTPERDFIHVDDVVDLYLEIAQRLPAEEVAGEVFNGGHNQPVKILDLVHRILRLSGAEDLQPDIRGVGTGHGEIDRQWLDSSKAREVLGWTPKVSLEAGMKKTIEWYRDYFAEGSNPGAGSGEGG